MSSNPVLSQLQQLVRLLYGLYSINTLVLLMALLIALAPTRPQFMNALDDSLYTFLASPSQLNLLKNERSLANAQSYDEMGLNDVAGSLASIFNGDAFRLSNTRDHLTPQAFHLVERIGLILIALF